MRQSMAHMAAAKTVVVTSPTAAGASFDASMSATPSTLETRCAMSPA